MDTDYGEILTHADSDWEEPSDIESRMGTQASGVSLSQPSQIPGPSTAQTTSSRKRKEPTSVWTKGGNYRPEPKTCAQHKTALTNNTISVASSPLEILQSILTDDIITSIVEESNRFVPQVQKIKPKAFSKWKELTKDEFWRFWMLNLLMGINEKPSIKDYWSTDTLLHTPIFGQTMCRNRFEEILRSLHFVNNDTLPSIVTDRFHKLGILLPRLNENFANLITPGEYLCIDESLLPHHGRLSFKQYNPLKRARFGIKVMALVDCDSKIMINLLPYQGKTTQLTCADTELGFGGRAVVTMMDGYMNSGHRLVIDNWYMSPKLAHHLLSLDTYVLGTVRKTRKDMPKMQGKLKKGECETFNNGKIMVERWMDNREVLMLNSFMSHEMTNVTTSLAKNNREKPESVLVYNKTMGAVDDVDKQMRPYESLQKTIKWYKKFAFYLLDLCVYNAYRVYIHLDSQRKRPRYKKFILDLIREVLKCGKRNKEATTSTSTKMHLPVCCLSDSGDKKYSNCWYCYNVLKKRKQTCFKCTCCDKRLCIQNANSCFVMAHKNVFEEVGQAEPNNNSELQNLPAVGLMVGVADTSQSTIFSESILSVNM